MLNQFFMVVKLLVIYMVELFINKFLILIILSFINYFINALMDLL
jgi:hypothetical protein